mmetsp:Transcript_37103/g.72883  ORF Transcript_37103/g.72883 Transcript_37103/m.72883 type:complete len:793 (+) Transcript_37103:39-2417(+)
MSWRIFFAALVGSVAGQTSSPTSAPTVVSVSDDQMQEIIFTLLLAIFSIGVLVLVRKIWALLTNRNEVHLLDNQADSTNMVNWKMEAADIEIGHPVGTGVTGKVFRGKWRGLTVAVKEIPIGGGKDEAALEANMNLILKVRHPHLALFMGLAQPNDEKLWLVTEFLDQGSLFNILHDKKINLDWHKRIAMARNVAQALNNLHCAKPPILHKTLNSINVLVGKDDVAKVSDYGLDFVRDLAKAQAGSTQFQWIAPEVFEKKKHGKSSDVYSFGIILWELMTRQTPYREKLAEGGSISAIQAITKGFRPEIPKATPPAMTALIEACWNKDPMQRPTFESICGTLAKLANTEFDVSALVEASVVVDDDYSAISTKQPWMVDSAQIKMKEKIGAGSFGEVWLGEWRGGQVAIKKMLLQKRSNIKAFVNELNVMNNLRHPNMLQVMGACIEQDSISIIMEYCEKGNLYEILQDKSIPVDYNRILSILMQIADGINYLHLSNPPILHRDLKSLNILITEDWNAKVADFGLSGNKPDVEEKSENLQYGTPFWLAPEVMQSKEFSEASDVYGFAMIILELFTRQVPFPDMNPHQAALAVVTKDLRPKIPEFIPPGFAQLIADCWTRNPKQRPTMKEVIPRLKKLKEDGLPRTNLSLKNSKLWRKKVTVFAFRSKDPVTVSKSWGTGEGKPGDYVVVGQGEDVYTCDYAIFKKTYAALPDLPHMYRKIGKIFALKMDRDFLIETLEGMEHGKKGDYIAQNPVEGEQWPIDEKTFESMYEVAPDQKNLQPVDDAKETDSLLG